MGLGFWAVLGWAGYPPFVRLLGFVAGWKLKGLGLGSNI